MGRKAGSRPQTWSVGAPSWLLRGRPGRGLSPADGQPPAWRHGARHRAHAGPRRPREVQPTSRGCSRGGRERVDEARGVSRTCPLGARPHECSQGDTEKPGGRRPTPEGPPVPSRSPLCSSAW